MADSKIEKLERQLARTTDPFVQDRIITDLNYLYEQEELAAEPTEVAYDEFAMIGEDRMFGGAQ